MYSVATFYGIVLKKQPQNRVPFFNTATRRDVSASKTYLKLVTNQN